MNIPYNNYDLHGFAYNDMPESNGMRQSRHNPSFVSGKVVNLFFKGLYYVQSILKALVATSPFFEEYGPILKELPKLYHLMNAFKEIQENDGEVEANEANEATEDALSDSYAEEDEDVSETLHPVPILYI